jgi:hypothetical protein
MEEIILATWVAHFRIAENLMNMGLRVSEKEFLVGNIGPDCGLPNDQVEGGFYPPKQITHFKVENKINPSSFFEKYLNKDCIDIGDPKFSFYLGYYLHLITDVEWSRVHNEKKMEPMHQEILGTPEYTRIIKGDWYGGDFLYLSENKDNIFNNVFKHIKNFPDYLDIFPENQVSKQINRITEFYLGDSYAYALEPTYTFKYFTPDDVTKFVNYTTEKLANHLNATFGEGIWGKQEIINN